MKFINHCNPIEIGKSIGYSALPANKAFECLSANINAIAGIPPIICAIQIP
jgi:hypothetical protein